VSGIKIPDIYLFIYKQSMMAGQVLKRSLAMERLTKIGTHIHIHTKHYKQKTRWMVKLY